ncbi:hypothetical protein [Streptomyces sp. NPDC017520]|uniref:hypothetical protein n=1 Tax=Streptomyces sp. NPDC017520 TaxID=3364998 RepID=UPI0037BB82CF
MDSAMTVFGSIVIAKAFALTALWLRLHRRAQSERERHHCLLEMAGKLPTGGTVEMGERGDTGHYLCVRIEGPPADGEKGLTA